MADSPITVTIQTGDTSGNYTAQISGSVTRNTTSDDRRAFGLSDDDVKEAIDRMWNRRPDDVVWNDPTPGNWPNFFEFNWSPIQVRTRPVSATVTSVTLAEDMVDREEFGPFSDETEVKIEFATKKTNRAVASWTKTANVSVAGSIGYDIGFFASSASVDGNGSWGQAATIEEETVVSSRVSVKVTIPPEEVRRYGNFATRAVAEVDVVYATTLTGGFYLNYSDPFQAPGQADPHHFYWMDVGSVMAALGKSNYLSSVEQLAIEAYGFSAVREIRDGGVSADASADTPQVLLTNQQLFEAGDPPG